jgi:hypothetical protein
MKSAPSIFVLLSVHAPMDYAVDPAGQRCFS